VPLEAPPESSSAARRGAARLRLARIGPTPQPVNSGALSRYLLDGDTASTRAARRHAGFAPVPELDPEPTTAWPRRAQALLGIDLTQYKPAQVWRRVNGFATAKGLADADALVAKAKQDAVLRQAFLDMLTINVSEFFRNPEAWDASWRSSSSRCCSASSPSESGAPAARSATSRSRSPCWPGDRAAHSGLHPGHGPGRHDPVPSQEGHLHRAQMAGVSPGRRARFFRKVDNNWEAKPELQAMITWRRHDLLRDPYEHPFDIICCRNVVIYFTEAAKAELYKRFCDAPPARRRALPRRDRVDPQRSSGRPAAVRRDLLPAPLRAGPTRRTIAADSWITGLRWKTRSQAWSSPI
jgi:chemotaxis protein methyltransferase CheR